MIEALPYLVIALVFWFGVWLAIDHIYDFIMGRNERRRRGHRRNH